MTATERNWAGNIGYGAARIDHPTTVEQVQALVRESTKVRVVGSRHSFNEIADTDGTLLALDQLARVVMVDTAGGGTVTVDGGIRYGELGQQLHAAGYALHNLASLPHISVAGACATATHGSGDRNGNLATAVTAMEIVTANGEIVAVSREGNPEQFDGMVVALGALGVVTRLTLTIEPTYQVRQDVYEDLPWQAVDDTFDVITSSGYSVSMFTNWRPQSVNQVWLKRRVTDMPAVADPHFYGASAAPVTRHPIVEISAESCTEQQGVAGAWYERLPHFRMDFMPSAGNELQTEYFVPRRHAVAAMQALVRMHERLAPLLLISEVRTIAADRLWLSPCYQQNAVGLHFTWKQDWPAVRQLLPQIEAVLEPFEARPHWGKLFTMAPERVQQYYPQMAAFRELLLAFDPDGKFRNPFVQRVIFGAA